MDELLLLIDDDQNLLALLQKIFEDAGYRIRAARNAAEALSELANELPDLIVLDLVLPDMDGYDLLEKIKANQNWAYLPVVILSSKRTLDDKLRGLRLGAMDYLTKPFEREELKARIRNILDFYRMKVRKRDIPARTSHQRLLDFMYSRGVKSLVPKVRPEAPLGYEYPEAAEIFHPEEVGGEIYVLESMAKAKMLERVFYDTIHICKRCGHHDLNFREVCPFCDYADLVVKRLITHLSCGRQGLEDEFWSNDELRCPECGDALHHEGEDYETFDSTVYMCAGCRAEFADPIVNCRCIHCDALFDVGEAERRKIYAYKLISDWEDAIMELPESSTPVEIQHLMEKMRAMQLHYVGLEGFARQLEREIRRAAEEDCSVSLLGLRFTQEAAGHTIDSRELDLCFDAILAICKSILRDYDVISIREPFEWLIMLPETPFRMSKILAERLVAAMSRLEFDIRLELNMASYPEDGKHARELLEVLNLGIINFQALHT